MDEFSKVISYHRKAAIRLFHRGNQPKANKKRGRPRQYGAAVVGVLRVAWEATDRLCSKRPHPFLPELIKALRRHGDSTMTTEIEAQLCRMSPSHSKLKFNNSREGFEVALKRARIEMVRTSSRGVIFAIETGGHYWRNLAYFLDERGIPFHFINQFTLKRRRGEKISIEGRMTIGTAR